MKVRFLILLSLFAVLFSSCHKKENKQLVVESPNPFDKLHPLDIKLQPPVPGDWLYSHKEPGQTFEQYKASKPIRPTDDRKIIYFQPIGIFTPWQKKVIDYNSEYISIFYNLPTHINEVISDEIVPLDYQRWNADGRIQLPTKFILDSILLLNIPKDAIVVMAITSKDLFTGHDNNFVFGQANLRKRIGVSSIFRFSEYELDSTNYTLCLERFIRTSAHEIGHMFGITHCTFAACLMNGSNSMEESDSRPNHLCSECMIKIYWNLNFSVEKRYKELYTFFEQHSFKEECKFIKESESLLKP